MQKQKLNQEQKEKMLLKFLHSDYKINTQQYWNDLDIFNKECARYLVLKWNVVKNSRNTDKWINIRTHEFWWSCKHVLRSEYESFKSSLK